MACASASVIAGGAVWASATGASAGLSRAPKASATAVMVMWLLPLLVACERAATQRRCATSTSLTPLFSLFVLHPQASHHQDFSRNLSGKTLSGWPVAISAIGYFQVAGRLDILMATTGTKHAGFTAPLVCSIDHEGLR